MVSLMQRRRMMMQSAGASPSGPLYQLKQGVSSFSGRSATITGAHVLDANTGGNTGARSIYISDTYGGKDPPAATWFTLHSGDVATLKIKNISYTNYYTSGSASYAVGPRDTDGNSSGIGHTFSLPKGGSGTFADTEDTVTFSDDIDIGSMFFYAQRKSTVEFDLELWVNGIRYI